MPQLKIDFKKKSEVLLIQDDYDFLQFITCQMTSFTGSFSGSRPSCPNGEGFYPSMVDLLATVHPAKASQGRQLGGDFLATMHLALEEPACLQAHLFAPYGGS